MRVQLKTTSKTSVNHVKTVECQTTEHEIPHRMVTRGSGDQLGCIYIYIYIMHRKAERVRERDGERERKAEESRKVGKWKSSKVERTQKVERQRQ